MSTIKTGTTTTTGLIVEADTSGNLVVQTGSTPTTALTISGTNQQVTLAAPLVNPVPLFMAYRDVSTQSFTSGATPKVQLNAVSYDTDSWFDATTNYRYTPQKAGYYQFNALTYISGTNLTTAVARIYKNNAVTIDGTFLVTTAATYIYVSASGLIYLNGSTDYVELFVFGIGTSPKLENGVTKTWLQGFLVRAA